MFYNVIKDVSTLNHSCPYSVRLHFTKINRILYIDFGFQGLQVVSDFHRVSLPVPLPSGDYLVCLDFIFDGKTQFFVNIYSHVVEDF